MDVVNEDINYTFDVLNGYNNEKYSNIYFKSNEDLNNLFGTFDFKDIICYIIGYLIIVIVKGKKYVFSR